MSVIDRTNDLWYNSVKDFAGWLTALAGDVCMENRLLYEDKYLLIVCKPAGMPSQPDPSGQTDLLTTLSGVCPTVGLVHRLDTPTGGVMVFGKTPAATARLSALVQDHTAFVKEYLCVLPGLPETPEGELTDLLFHDRRMNKTFPVDRPRAGAKQARLTYRTVATDPVGHTLTLVRLFTGRTHQIRAQFAARKLPLLGDGKYGSREKCPFIALWSYRVTFTHPWTGKPVTASCLPDTASAPWRFFTAGGNFPNL